MASIHAYLQDLEARLAPALDAQALQERLTEAENHLRDRALEFEEVGLPPKEAEARAVAAFGEVEEYVEDVPPGMADVSKPASVTPLPRGTTFQLAASVLTLGVLASIVENLWPLAMAVVAVAALLAVGALFGRPTTPRRLASLSLALSGAVFALLMAVYVPGFDPLVAANRNEVQAPGPNGSHMDAFFRFERQARLFREHGDVSRASGTGYADAAQEANLYEAPNPDGYTQSYTNAADATRAWRINGAEARDALLAAARREGLQFDVNATPSERILPFGLDAMALGVAFFASILGLQIVAGAIRAASTGLRRRPDRTQPRPPYGELERFRSGSG